jgi:hypothetical protein
MKKKTIIWIAIAVLAVIGILLYMHYTPVWVSLSNLVVAVGGVIAGWILNILYVKYIKTEEEE